MPANPEEYSNDYRIREAVDDVQEDAAGRSAVHESRSVQDNPAADDRRAAGDAANANPAAADARQTRHQADPAAEHGNDFRSVADQDHARFPGSAQATNEHPGLSEHRSQLQGISPADAWQFARGENVSYMSEQGRLDYATNHVAAFRNTDFPTLGEKMEAANAIAGAIMEPLRQDIHARAAVEGKLTEAELAQFDPRDRALYQSRYNPEVDVDPAETQGSDPRRMLAAIQTAWNERGADHRAHLEESLTAIDSFQTGFKLALYGADGDQKHAAEAYANLNGAAAFTEKAGSEPVNYKFLSDLAEKAVWNEDQSATLELMVETKMNHIFKESNEAVAMLALNDPAKAAVLRDLNTTAIGHAVKTMTDALENGITENEYDRLVVSSQQKAQETLETVNNAAQVEFKPIHQMTQEELFQFHEAQHNFITNEMPKSETQQEIQQLSEHIMNSIRVVREVAATPIEAMNDLIATTREQIDDTIDHAKRLIANVDIQLTVEQVKAAKAAAAG